MLCVARWLVALGLSVACNPPAPPRDHNKDIGVALGLFASSDRYDYAPLLKELATTGATSVQLDVVWTQANVASTTIAPFAGTSPSIDRLRTTIAQARALGLTVTLFPIVALRSRTAEQWRGTLAPDNVALWFDSYRAFIITMADVAQASGVATLSVGSELCSLEGEQQHWRDVIAVVRRRFDGALLYSANWDQLDTVMFWDALDQVGVTGYFKLANGASATSTPALSAAWSAPLAQLATLRARTHKPLMMTEVGWPSHARAAHTPWDETTDAAIDVDLQARLYRAFCDATAHDDTLAGVTFWNWFGAGGSDDRGYTVRGKPALSELSACVRRLR